MARRLRILLVDALVLLALLAVAYVVLGRKTSDASSLDRVSAHILSTQETRLLPLGDKRSQALAERLRDGQDLVSAYVAPRPSQGLIFPGDRVDLVEARYGEVLFKDLRVLAIDPSLDTDRQIRMTFALPIDHMRRFREFRESLVLSASLSDLDQSVRSQAFEPPRPNEIIVRRFSAENFMHRVPLQ